MNEALKILYIRLLTKRCGQYRWIVVSQNPLKLEGYDEHFGTAACEELDLRHGTAYSYPIHALWEWPIRISK